MGFNQVRSNRKDVWSDSGAFELPAGKVELKVETVRPPWAPGSKKVWRVFFARAVLTERNDFIPDLEQEYPWGDRVGTGDVGFWVAKDPWCAFSRFSPAAEGKYFASNGEKRYRSYLWTPVADGEVDRGEHPLEAMRGEVVSQLVVVRNNTDSPIRFTPAFAGDLSARCRVVAWSPVYAISPAYVAEARVSGEARRFLPGATIEIVGSAVETDGVTPAVGETVEIYLVCGGLRQTLEAQTDADGAFSAVFAPLDDDFSKPLDHRNNLESLEHLRGWTKICKTWTWSYPAVYTSPRTVYAGLARSAADVRIGIAAGLMLALAMGFTFFMTPRQRNPFKNVK